MEYLALFRHFDFLKLWLAQIASQVGQNLLNFALIILVYDLTLGSRFANLSVALLIIAFGLPALLFASTAGSYVDYWDRRKVLVATNLLRAILVLGYIWAENNLALILILSFVISSILQFFFPAETATIPNIVPKSVLLPANSLFIFSLYASFIVGYSLSGPAIRVLGHHGPYWAVSAMFLAAALLCAWLPKQGVARPGSKLPKPDMLLHLRANWQLVTSHGERFFSVLQLTVTQGMVAILVALAPAMSLALLHIPLQDASHVLIIPIGIGMVLGVLAVNAVARNRSKTAVIQICLVVASATLTLLGLSAHLYDIDGNTEVPIATISVIVAVLMLVLGMINAMISATAQTLLQESTSHENRGRVFASLNMLINLAGTAPVIVIGLMADLLSVTTVITILGALFVVYAVYMGVRYQPGTFTRKGAPEGS